MHRWENRGKNWGEKQTGEWGKRGGGGVEGLGLLSFSPSVSMLIRVSSLPLTKCRHGEGQSTTADPSSFTGLSDNKDRCLRGMLPKECSAKPVCAPQRRLYEYESGYQMQPGSSLRQCSVARRSAAFPGLKSSRCLSREPLQPDLPICFAEESTMGKILPGPACFLTLVVIARAHLSWNGNCNQMCLKWINLEQVISAGGKKQHQCPV